MWYNYNMRDKKVTGGKKMKVKIVLVAMFFVGCLFSYNAFAHLGYDPDTGEATIVHPDGSITQGGETLVPPLDERTDPQTTTTGSDDRQNVTDEPTQNAVADAVSMNGGNMDTNGDGNIDDGWTVQSVGNNAAQSETAGVRGRAQADNDAFTGALADAGIDPIQVPAVQAGDIVAQTGTPGEVGYQYYVLRHNAHTDRLEAVYSENRQRNEAGKQRKEVKIYDEDSYSKYQRKSKEYTVHYGTDGKGEVLDVQPDVTDNMTSSGKWGTASSKGIQDYNKDGDNVTADTLVNKMGWGNILEAAGVNNPADVASFDVSQDPATGKINKVVFYDADGTKIGEYPPKQSSPGSSGGGNPALIGGNGSGGGAATPPAGDVVWNSVESEVNARQNLPFRNRMDKIGKEQMNGLGVGAGDVRDILNAAEKDPQAAQAHLLSSLGLSDDKIAVFNGFETRDEKFAFLKELYISQGLTEEEAAEKANGTLQTLSWLGNYSALLGMEPAERIQYLKDEMGLSQFTSQLIAGYVLNEDGTVEELPDDYLTEIENAVKEFFASHKLDNDTLKEIKAQIITALYSGELMPENINEILQTIADGLEKAHGVVENQE